MCLGEPNEDMACSAVVTQTKKDHKAVACTEGHLGGAIDVVCKSVRLVIQSWT